MRPVLAAQVERRLLVNYRADPEVVARLLPPPFRPQLVDGAAVVGICLIRLGSVRPTGWPRSIGASSENAAHRIAVEWPGDDGVRAGVYIPRRDSSSWVNTVVGGRLYPGAHHRADFDVAETDDALHVAFASRDGACRVSVDAAVTTTLGSVLFDGLASASRFFEAGAVGFSPDRAGRGVEGLELQTESWTVQPVALDHVRSTLFDDPRRFPDGSIALDCGLLMRQVPVRWREVAPPRGCEASVPSSR